MKDRRPLAFAHPPNLIAVTKALLDECPRDERIAAIAHEIGHLIADGHATPPFALSGLEHSHNDAEHEADAIGCRLLVHAGELPAAMSRLLMRLSRDERFDLHTRQSLAQRAERIEAR